MIRVLVAVCFTLLFLPTTAHAQDAGCFKDTDCKGSRICVDKACVDAPPVKSCARDLDCPGDDICEQHLCLPPANAKKTKGKPSHRDLIKESARKAQEQKIQEQKAQEQKEQEAAAQAATPAPAPVVTPAPVPAPIPTPPPQLIEPKPPEPAPVVTAPGPAPAPVAAPAPAQNQPPAPPPDLITAPPPPLVAAAPPPPQADTGDNGGVPGFVGGVALTAGIHLWSADASETDFGLDLNGDVGVRVSRNFGIEVIGQGSYTPMLASRTGLLGGLGLGVRLENLGPIPGHFLLGGMGSFAAISADNVATINVSGGSLLLQYGIPVLGPMELQGQMGIHFLSSSLTLFTLSAGIAFGN